MQEFADRVVDYTWTGLRCWEIHHRTQQRIFGEQLRIFLLDRDPVLDQDYSGIRGHSRSDEFWGRRGGGEAFGADDDVVERSRIECYSLLDRSRHERADSLALAPDCGVYGEALRGSYVVVGAADCDDVLFGDGT